MNDMFLLMFVTGYYMSSVAAKDSDSGLRVEHRMSSCCFVNLVAVHGENQKRRPVDPRAPSMDYIMD